MIGMSLPSEERNLCIIYTAQQTGTPQSLVHALSYLSIATAAAEMKRVNDRFASQSCARGMTLPSGEQESPGVGAAGVIIKRPKRQQAGIWMDFVHAPRGGPWIFFGTRDRAMVWRNARAVHADGFTRVARPGRTNEKYHYFDSFNHFDKIKSYF